MTLKYQLIATKFLLIAFLIQFVPPSFTKSIKNLPHNSKILKSDSSIHEEGVENPFLDSSASVFDIISHSDHGRLGGHNFKSLKRVVGSFSGDFSSNLKIHKFLSRDDESNDNKGRDPRPGDGNEPNNRKKRSYLQAIFSPIKNNWCNPAVVPLTVKTTCYGYLFVLIIFSILFAYHLMQCSFMANYGWSSFDFYRLWRLINTTSSEIETDPEFNSSQILNDLRIIGYSESKVGTMAFRFLAISVVVSHLIVYYLIANELCLSVESSVNLWDDRARGYILNCILSILMIALYYILSGNDRILFLQTAPLSCSDYILVGKISECQRKNINANFGYRHFEESPRGAVFDFEINTLSLLLLLLKLFVCKSFWNCHYKIIKVETQGFDGKFSSDSRRFTHECVNYVYNSALDSFVDSSELMKNYLNYTNLSDLMKNGGLTDAQASERMNNIGLNEIDVEMPSFYDLFWREVTDYIFLIQLFVTYKSVYWRNLITAPIWATMVFFNILNKVLLIRQRQLEVQTLASKNCNSLVDVLRGNTVRKISTKYLTIGDVVRVQNNWLVPCDMILLRGNVSMDESALTGESVPVQKVQLPSNVVSEMSLNLNNKYAKSHRNGKGSSVYARESPRNYYPHEHVLKAGTSVVAIVGSDESSFETVAVVIATGVYTMKGSQIKGMLFPSQIQLKYDAQLPLVIVLTSIYALGCALYQGFVLGWNMTCVFYGIGTFAQVIPLWTPTIVSIGQNKACERLLNDCSIRCTAPARVAICGKIRIMCFDKTGTITEPGLSFSALHCEKPASNGPLLGVTSDPRHINLEILSKLANSDLYSGGLNNLNLMVLGASVCHSLVPDHNGVSGLNAEKSMFTATGCKLDVGVDRNGEAYRSVHLPLDRKVDVVKVFDFSHHLKTSSVIISIPDYINCDSGDYLVFCKGSFEAISAACTSSPPSEEIRLAMQNFCSQGMYTIAMGYKFISEKADQDSPLGNARGRDSLGPELPRKLVKMSKRDHIECDLHFLGLILFRNKLRPDAHYVFNTLRQVRVRPVILTGDDPLTAISVAEEIGIIQNSLTDTSTPVSGSFIPHHGIKSVMKHDLVIGRLELQNGVVWRFIDSNMLIDDYEIYSSDFFTDLIITGDAFDYLISNWGQIVSNAVSGYSKSINSTSIFDWGSLWRKSKVETPDQVYFEKLLLRIRLFARLQPDAFNDLGIITGMCGDGNNDCGALQVSHAGISLSEGEASIVSPFTSTTKQLSSVIDLIREGRASLVTSVACYKFMLLYGFLIALVKILLFKSCKAVMPEWGYLILDNLIVITLSRAMANSRSSEQLKIRSPTSSLLGPQTILSAGVMLLINIIYMAILFYVLRSYLPSSYEFNKKIPPAAWWKLSDNYEAPLVCIWLCYQVTNAAMVFSFGDVFRETVFYNYRLTLWWVCINSFLAILVVKEPSILGCIFRINCTDQISRQTIIPLIKHLSPSCNGMPFHGQLGHNILDLPFKKAFIVLNLMNVVTNMLVAKFFILGELSARVRKYVQHKCSADRITI